MGDVLRQTRLQLAVIGATLLAGTGEFSGTDVTAKLDVSGVSRIQSISIRPIRASGSTQQAGMGDVSATKTLAIKLPRVRGNVTSIKITASTGVATSDVNYWSFGVINKGTNGLGAAVVVDSTNAANTTKATGGSAVVAATPRALTITGVAPDKAVTEEQVLELTITRTGAATTLGTVTVEIIVTGTALAADEDIHVDELLAGGQIEVPADGKITLRRGGVAPSVNLGFAYQVIGY